MRITLAKQRKPKKQIGYSLTELMVAVALVGILAAIAYPSYQDHVQKVRRSAAQQALIEISGRQEQFLLDNLAYTADLNNINYTVPTEVAPFYTISVTLSAGPPQGYTISATAIGTQLNDGDLSYASDGTKSPASKW